MTKNFLKTPIVILISVFSLKLSGLDIVNFAGGNVRECCSGSTPGYGVKAGVPVPVL